MARWLAPAICAFTLGACASLPPPTGELAAARQAVTRADGADADQYAADVFAQAQGELSRAQAAMAKGRDDDARALAAAASADADLAFATSTAATTRADFAQHRSEIVDLHQRLQMQGEVPQHSPLDALPAGSASSPAGAGSTPAARLQALEADPALNAYAAYERLRAHQAVDALAAARSRERDDAAHIADRRVAVAELAARTEATRHEIQQLERERSDLLVEASRQEAERARQEAEQLRVQAQVQAEEAQRLREQAEAEAAARQQAEDVIVDVGAEQAARLKAARDKDAALAKQEAALMAGEKPTTPGSGGKAKSKAGSGAKSGSAASNKKKKKATKTSP